MRLPTKGAVVWHYMYRTKQLTSQFTGKKLYKHCIHKNHKLIYANLHNINANSKRNPWITTRGKRKYKIDNISIPIPDARRIVLENKANNASKPSPKSKQERYKPPYAMHKRSNAQRPKDAT